MGQHDVASIFQRVKKDDSFKQMFFKKLSTTSNPYPWFDKLSEEGYLDPKINNKNPIVTGNNYTIPYWSALDYLENVASSLSKKPDKLILDRLVEVINSIIDFKEDGKRIENPYTDYKVIKIIFMLPIDRITEKLIDFIQTALTSKFSSITLISSEMEKTVIPYLVDRRAKDALLRTLKIILNYKTDKENTFSFLDFKSVLEDYWLSEIIRKNADKIIDICGIALAELIVDIMKSILEKDKNSFSYAVIHTVEENTQNFLEDNYELQLVSLLRSTLESLKPPTQESMLKDFLKSDSSIFKRIGIHLINHFYQEYNQLFWQGDSNPLEEYALKHEIYELIKDNNKKLTDAQIDKFLKWVESIKLHAIKDTPEGSPHYLEIDAYNKIEWLSALNGIDSKKVNSLKAKYTQFYKGKIEHPGYIFWTAPVQVSVGAPEVFPPEVIAKSNSDLVKYILEYKPKEPSFYPNREDILYSFSGVVRENPSKFACDINPFLNLDFSFQESLVSGFTNAWRKNKQFPLRPIFEFLNEITSSQRYKDDKSQQKNFFTKSIADLIFEGTRDEKHVFDDEFLPLIELILLRLATNAYSTVTSEARALDVLTAVLNSPLGIVYYAMITYSLRFARVKNKDKEEKWVNSIKAYYQSIIDSNRTIEFEVSLGTFLPQLYFLDKEWTIVNLNKLFPKENEIMWKYGFSSYLFHSTTLSKDLYCLLKENGHYKKALESVEKDAFEKLPQHICIAYLNDLEDLEKGSLLTDLIKGDNISYLSGFVNFLWHLRGKLDERMKGKVKPVWGAIISHISSIEEKDKYRDVLAHLSYWLILVDDIDGDIVNWMKYSNKYMNDVGSMFYVEYLNNHVAKNPEQVAEIFYDLLSNSKYFPYIKPGEVIALVTSLFERGQKEKTNRICNAYLSKGFEFLRTVYEKNNPKS